MQYLSDTTSSNLKSLKGFIAIDIDGTALIEKIDKHPLYGWSNPKSHLRQLLVQYMIAAQKAGYDILILTARPELVDSSLKRMQVGTKSTATIVNILHEVGVTVKPPIMRAPVSLKGKKMQQILQDYSPGTIGILFDDQLKQIEDVNKQKNPCLFAYDINSLQDLEQFLTYVSLPEGTAHVFHPQRMIQKILDASQHPSVAQKQLINLNHSVNKVSRTDYSEEIQLIIDIIHNLCIRLYETQYRNYEPDIIWCNVVTKNMQLIVDKLSVGENITLDDVQCACSEIFGTSYPSVAKLNSKCELLINELLEAVGQSPLI